MDNIKEERTRVTPGLDFDAEKGLIEVEGRLIPESDKEVFEEWFQWLDEYAANPQPETTVRFALAYFNTSSSRFLLEFFTKLGEVNKQDNTQIKLQWVYENDDDDMKEAGHDYEAMISIPVEMVPVDRIMI